MRKVQMGKRDDDDDDDNNNNNNNKSHLENTCATYHETMKSRNYRKQPYWALHTCFGKY